MIGDDDFPFRQGGFDELEARGKLPRSREKALTLKFHGPHCPTCGGRTSKVTDSRSFSDGSIKRRRKCLNGTCDTRYSTWETTYDPRELKKPDISEADKRRINQIALMAHRLDATYNKR